jgi:hypothetical protein
MSSGVAEDKNRLGGRGCRLNLLQGRVGESLCRKGPTLEQALLFR